MKSKSKNKEFETLGIDLWDVMPTEVKRSVERGLIQSKNGETKSNAEVMAKYKKWFNPLK